MLIVAALPFKHHAYINVTEIRLQQTKQLHQRIKNVCSRLNESQDADWFRLFVSDQRKYIYCSTPKVASSSWKRTLLNLSGVDLSNVTNIHNCFYQMTHNFYWHNSPAQREARLKKYFKFMFVREPLERLVSAYRDKCFRDPKLSEWFAAKIKKRRRWANNTDQGETTKQYRYKYSVLWNEYELINMPLYIHS